MAQAFLRDLLQPHNRVRDNENQECVICRETVGTMSRTTGLSETAVRTSCGHVVGSGCIAKWLRENNNCPMCRHEFFPAVPYIDRDEDIESRSDRGSIFDHDNMIEDHQSDHVHIHDLPTPRSQLLNGTLDERFEWFGNNKRRCAVYCNRLRLQPEVAKIAQSVCCNLLEPGNSTAGKLADSSDDFLVAVSIYLASHLMRQPKTAEDIARTIGISDLNTCSDIHSFSLRRYRDEILGEYIRDDLYRLLNSRTLTWPPDRTLPGRESIGGSFRQVEPRDGGSRLSSSSRQIESRASSSRPPSSSHNIESRASSSRTPSSFRQIDPRASSSRAPSSFRNTESRGISSRQPSARNTESRDTSSRHGSYRQTDSRHSVAASNHPSNSRDSSYRTVTRGQQGERRWR